MKQIKILTMLLGLVLISQAVYARPISIATTARVKTSSSFSSEHASANINDGIIADDEIVQPSSHRVYLPKSKVWVEQTATERVSFYKFKWSKDLDAQTLLSLNGLAGNSRMTNAVVDRVDNRSFEGSISSVDRAYGGIMRIAKLN